MVDFAAQRKNMVESQVRTGDVTDRRLIAAMLAIPREEFLPEAMRPLAYMDGEVRLAPAAPGTRPRALMEPRTSMRTGTWNSGAAIQSRSNAAPSTSPT